MFLDRLTKKSDEELMLLIRQGEERAFTELYHRYSKCMVRYFHRMLWKDEGKAQDFLHDLFVKIIERPASFDVSKKFSTWIYSVAHNMCKNEYRKVSLRESANLQQHENEWSENEIHEHIDQRDFASLLENAMQHWPEDDRSLFVFRHELEMSFSEIALVLNCPEGTARSRWFYLKKNLASRFQKFQMILK